MSGGIGGAATVRITPTGTLVFRVRCVGPASLRVAVTIKRVKQDVVVDRCDGLFHTYLGPRVTDGDKVRVEPFGDQNQSYAVIDYSVRP
jgi:hypothetical protein